MDNISITKTCKKKIENKINKAKTNKQLSSICVTNVSTFLNTHVTTGTIF